MPVGRRGRVRFTKKATKKGSSCKIDEAKLNFMIKERAYYIWKEKGKLDGGDFDIWLQAEKDIARGLKKIIK